MDARQAVTAALSALIRCDLSGHLPYVHEDVVSGLAQLPTQRGKPAYQELLGFLRDSGETSLEFRTEDTFPLPHGQTGLRIADRRRFPVPPPREGLNWFRSIYIVDDEKIVNAA